MTHHIKTNLFERDRKEIKQNNFTKTLQKELSVLAVEQLPRELKGILPEPKELAKTLEIKRSEK